MGKPYHFLYLEDSDFDVQIFTSALQKGNIDFDLVHVKTREDYVKALETDHFDIIFSDYALPAFDGMSALEMAREKAPTTPFIIVSGNIGEELAIETLKRGATDYVLKSHFARLIPSIQRALEEKSEKEHRRTAEEIKSRYDFIVNSSRNFLSLVNRDYAYEAINNAFCSAHNLVREEIIGKKLSEIWGEENFHKEIKKNLDQSFANKEIHYQAWFETPRDGLRCFEVSFFPYKNKKGEITHTVVNTVDITEKKRAEQALRESEEKYRTVVEKARDGIVILVSGKVVFANSHLLELSGYSMQEVMEQPFERFIHPGYRRKVVEMYHMRNKEPGIPSLYETVLQKKDGTELLMEVNVGLTRFQGKNAELVVLRDITSRKKTEEALRISEMKFKSFVEQTPEGIVIVDESGRVAEWNPGSELLTGIRRVQVLHRYVWDLQADINRLMGINGNAAKYRELTEKALTTGKADWFYRIEEKEILRNGEKLFIQLSVFPIKSSRGFMLGGVFRDITDRKKAEVMIRKQTEDLSLINDLNNAVNKGKTLKQIMGMLSRKTQKIFSGNGVSVFMLSENHHELVSGYMGMDARDVAATAGVKLPANTHLMSIPLKSSHPFLDALNKKKPARITQEEVILKIISSYFLEALSKSTLRKIKKALDIMAVLIIPLYIENEPVGVMVHSRGKPYEKEEVDRLFRLGGQVSSIIIRKRNEERMRDSEIRYRTVFETANDAIFLLKDGKVFDCNREALRMFGYSKNEFLGMEPAGFSPPQQPDGRPSSTSSYEKMKNTIRKGPQYFEWIHRRAGGSDFFAEVSLNTVRLKGEDYIQAIVRDISEKKKAGEEQRRLITAIEQSAETVMITNREGIILYVNPAFEQVTGYSRNEVTGKTPGILKSGKQSEEFYAELWETISHGKVWKGKIVNRKKDGSLFEEYATISPVRNESGIVENYVAVKRDITRESKLETQLRQVQKMETIGTLAGGIAHDFNNILGTIMGYTDMLKKELSEESGAHRDLEQIMKASQRGKDLVNKILTFSRQVDHRMEPVHFDRIVRESIEMLKPSLSPKIRIRSRIAADCPPLEGDPTQLQQVVMNLCTNAAYSMRKNGGVMAIALDWIESGHPELDKQVQLPAGKYLMLVVRDEGTGMASDVVPRIFEPFFTTKPVGEGTGLGLSVTHGIVKRMGGEIIVDTEEGEGSTFRVFFPYREPVS
ncbi:MAG TPA: PAS domain S-box protein [Bacteroidetes bacterium]|nr:PAS domain S-box protein [Bacteroidota bacterium]